MPRRNMQLFSATISGFLKTMESARRDYEWNYDEVGRLDRLTQDYLHMLELNDMSYGERAKLATKLAKTRRERRESKDTVEILTPLYDFLESDKGRNMINLMKEALGKTRKAERLMDIREYHYRVFEPDDDDEEGSVL